MKWGGEARGRLYAAIGVEHNAGFVEGGRLYAAGRHVGSVELGVSFGKGAVGWRGGKGGDLNFEYSIFNFEYSSGRGDKTQCSHGVPSAAEPQPKSIEPRIHTDGHGGKGPIS